MAGRSRRIIRWSAAGFFVFVSIPERASQWIVAVCADDVLAGSPHTVTSRGTFSHVNQLNRCPGKAAADSEDRGLKAYNFLLGRFDYKSVGIVREVALPLHPTAGKRRSSFDSTERRRFPRSRTQQARSGFFSIIEAFDNPH